MNTFFFDDVQYPEGLFGGKDFFNPIIYSTEEREVGVWIDNKPLYAKTYVIDSIPSNSYNYYTFASDIDKVINYQGVVIDSNDASMNICYIRPDNTNTQFYTQVLADKRFFFRTFIAWTASAYVTFYYTKTTDVAGSAQYTTLGVPAHHYDGEEKIIGTWFGETLYERTFSGLATNTNGDNWVNIGGIDASTWKDAINVEIYCNSSDVNNKLTRIGLGEARVFNGNVQVTTSVSYNREINVATIQYTKTT